MISVVMAPSKIVGGGKRVVNAEKSLKVFEAFRDSLYYGITVRSECRRAECRSDP